MLIFDKIRRIVARLDHRFCTVVLKSTTGLMTPQRPVKLNQIKLKDEDMLSARWLA
jgi:hypothetical protein